MPGHVSLQCIEAIGDRFLHMKKGWFNASVFSSYKLKPKYKPFWATRRILSLLGTNVHRGIRDRVHLVPILFISIFIDSRNAFPDHRVSCRSVSSQAGADNREQTSEQAFIHSLHGNIVSKSKSKTIITTTAPQLSVYNRMIEDTLLDHSPLQPGAGTSRCVIADIPYGNIRMPQPSSAGNYLVASTTSKNSILQDCNAKFCGPSSRSVLTKKKVRLILCLISIILCNANSFSRRL